MKKSNNEQGQILVILVLGFVALMGFTALSIDGGMVLSARRRAQNAADAAAMAAAWAKSQNQNWQTTGLNQANENGFTNDGVTSVTIFNPPTSGRYAPPFEYANDYFQVFITTEVDTAFAHFVYSGPLLTTVQAVARYSPPREAYPGNALHATNEDVCDGVAFDGSNSVEVNGGNVFSNSEADMSKNASCSSGEKSGSAGKITIRGGGVKVSGKFNNYTDIAADKTLKENADHEEVDVIPIPDCTGLPTVNSIPNGTYALTPGIYPNGIRYTNSNADVTLAEGMYCVGGEFTMNGGSIIGNKVMIYMMPNADFDLGGNTSVNLHADNDLIDASNTQWGGMLLYMHPSSTGQVVITGNAESAYTGMILATGPTTNPEAKPKCIISGTGDSLGLNSKVVCNTVNVTGNAKVVINYQEERNYHVPPRVELMK